MHVTFAWDPMKARTNLAKHDVSFAEAASTFEDRLSSTLPDDQHSEDEERFILVGMSYRQRLLLRFTLSSPLASVSSEPVLQPQPRGISMKSKSEVDALAERPNLDFRKGVRGKYANLLQEGSNVALIDDDLLQTFPDSRSVNEALRSLKQIAERTAKVPA